MAPRLIGATVGAHLDIDVRLACAVQSQGEARPIEMAENKGVAAEPKAARFAHLSSGSRT